MIKIGGNLRKRDKYKISFSHFFVRYCYPVIRKNQIIIKEYIKVYFSWSPFCTILSSYFSFNRLEKVEQFQKFITGLNFYHCIIKIFLVLIAIRKRLIY